MLALITNSILFYQVEKQSFYHEVDTKLYDLAYATAFIFGDSFHNQELNSSSVSNIENIKNALFLSKLTDVSNVKYVYTLIKKNKKVYFTCSSIDLEEQITNNSYIDFLLEYKEASKKLKNSFENGKSYYGEITDKYGSFRSIIVPRKLENGTYYVVGADIDISFIDKQLFEYLIKLLLSEFLFLIVFIFFLYIYLKASKKEEIQQKEKDILILEQSKLASMGEMLQNIAHQWRQPLSEINAVAMKIDADFYKQRLDALTLETYIQRIENITYHMSNTIESFNSYFKEHKQLDITTLEAIVNKALNIMDGSLKSIKVDLSIEDNSNININISELLQVILVILNNAVDALTLNNIENKTITIRVKKLNDKSILEIEDNAGGIKEENIEKIFEPYFSTKFKSNGTGVGLYMAKMLIEESLKGILSVSNAEDGARFTIRL